jgi:hypothetical protein
MIPKTFYFQFKKMKFQKIVQIKILNLTPTTLKYQTSFFYSGFDFIWNNGVKTNFNEGFKLSQGQNKGENIKYLYLSR